MKNTKTIWCEYHQRYEPAENFSKAGKFEALGKMCDLALQEAMSIAMSNTFISVTDTGEKPIIR